MNRKGLYIAFEGVVACGKTTQSKLLQKNLQNRFPNKQNIWTREPGGSEISDAIREVVQATPFVEEMDPVCEAYLYAASRAQTLRNVVFPTLTQNGIVIADRSFVTSLAFQGFARGLGIEVVLGINEIAIEGFIPDLVFYINLDPQFA
ncbi:dTMP kinase, partial [Patescibacteria group bacterium]|nr:dTMP kinase [Patescibacteria group bacterium]